MIKNFLPINAVAKYFTYERKFVDCDWKCTKFSKYIKKKKNRIFLWEKPESSSIIYISECNNCDFGNSKNTLENSNGLCFEEHSFNRVMSIIKKIDEANEAITETALIYQKSDISTVPWAQISVTGSKGEKNTYEGVIQVSELNNELQVYKNTVERNSHDIKNQLMLILAMANNIQHTSEDSNEKKYAYFIKDAVYSCNYMLSLMSDDTQIKPESKNKLFNVHHLIISMLDAFRYEGNIEFVNNMKAHNPRIYANKVLITNAIYNLIINAIQAIDHSGKITIQTQNKKQNSNSDFKCNEWLSIEIEDNGMGIEAENADKIFDQFFTTKTNCSGIGLYSAKITLDKHNGTINVHSQKGKGASFVVCLPCHVE